MARITANFKNSSPKVVKNSIAESMNKWKIPHYYKRSTSGSNDNTTDSNSISNNQDDNKLNQNSLILTPSGSSSVNVNNCSPKKVVIDDRYTLTNSNHINSNNSANNNSFNRSRSKKPNNKKNMVFVNYTLQEDENKNNGNNNNINNSNNVNNNNNINNSNSINNNKIINNSNNNNTIINTNNNININNNINNNTANENVPISNNNFNNNNKNNPYNSTNAYNGNNVKIDNNNLMNNTIPSIEPSNPSKKSSRRRMLKIFSSSKDQKPVPNFTLDQRNIPLEELQRSISLPVAQKGNNNNNLINNTNNGNSHNLLSKKSYASFLKYGQNNLSNSTNNTNKITNAALSNIKKNDNAIINQKNYAKESNINYGSSKQDTNSHILQDLNQLSNEVVPKSENNLSIAKSPVNLRLLMNNLENKLSNANTQVNNQNVNITTNQNQNAFIDDSNNMLSDIKLKSHLKLNGNLQKNNTNTSQVNKNQNINNNNINHNISSNTNSTTNNNTTSEDNDASVAFNKIFSRKRTNTNGSLPAIVSPSTSTRIMQQRNSSVTSLNSTNSRYSPVRNQSPARPRSSTKSSLSAHRLSRDFVSMYNNIHEINPVIENNNDSYLDSHFNAVITNNGNNNNGNSNKTKRISSSGITKSCHRRKQESISDLQKFQTNNTNTNISVATTPSNSLVTPPYMSSSFQVPTNSTSSSSTPSVVDIYNLNGLNNISRQPGSNYSTNQSSNEHQMLRTKSIDTAHFTSNSDFLTQQYENIASMKALPSRKAYIKKSMSAQNVSLSNTLSTNSYANSKSDHSANNVGNVNTSVVATTNNCNNNYNNSNNYNIINNINLSDNNYDNAIINDGGKNNINTNIDTNNNHPGNISGMFEPESLSMLISNSTTSSTGFESMLATSLSTGNTSMPHYNINGQHVIGNVNNDHNNIHDQQHNQIAKNVTNNNDIMTVDNNNSAIMNMNYNNDQNINNGSIELSNNALFDGNTSLTNIINNTSFDADRLMAKDNAALGDSISSLNVANKMVNNNSNKFSNINFVGHSSNLNNNNNNLPDDHILEQMYMEFELGNNTNNNGVSFFDNFKSLPIDDSSTENIIQGSVVTSIGNASISSPYTITSNNNNNAGNNNNINLNFNNNTNNTISSNNYNMHQFSIATENINLRTNFNETNNSNINNSSSNSEIGTNF